MRLVLLLSALFSATCALHGLDRADMMIYSDLIERIDDAVASANLLFGNLTPFTFSALNTRHSRWNQSFYTVKFSLGANLPRIVLLNGVGARAVASPHSALVFVNSLAHWLKEVPLVPPVLTNLTQAYAFEVLVSANPDGNSAFYACSKELANSSRSDGNLVQSPESAHPDASSWTRLDWETRGCAMIKDAMAPDAAPQLQRASVLSGIHAVGSGSREPEADAVALMLGLASAMHSSPIRVAPVGALVVGGPDRLDAVGDMEGVVVWPPSSGPPPVTAWWREGLATRLGRAMRSRSGRPHSSEAMSKYTDSGTGSTPCDRTSALCFTLTQPADVATNRALVAELADEIVTALFDLAYALQTDRTDGGTNNQQYYAHTAATSFGISSASGGVVLEQAYDSDGDGVADVWDARYKPVVSKSGSAELATLHVTTETASSSGVILLVILLLLCSVCACGVMVFCAAPCCKDYRKPVDLPMGVGGGTLVLPNIAAVRNAAYDPFGLNRPRAAHVQLQEDEGNA